MVLSLLIQSILEYIFQIHCLTILLKFHLILIVVIVENYQLLLHHYHYYFQYRYYSRAQISVKNVMRPKEKINKKQNRNEKNSVQESIERNRNCKPKRVLWYYRK